jgi:predicted nuclease of predicted toxin-antitoxin system
VIWLSVGNVTTDTILRILDEKHSAIETFENDSVESLLILELPEPAA